MAMFRQRWIMVLFLLTAGACSLAGCENGGHFEFLGYTTKPPFDPGIRSVYVPIAKNYSFLKDIEFDLTRQVINELNMRAGAPRVTSERARADSELIIKIVSVKKATILENQLGEVRDVEIPIVIEVIWSDLRPGHLGDILSNPKRYDPQQKPLPGDAVPPPPGAIPLVIMPSRSFVPELGGSFLVAQREAANRAAMQIVNMMEVWPSGAR